MSAVSWDSSLQGDSEGRSLVMEKVNHLRKSPGITSADSRESALRHSGK
ncbi:hypothetical protein BJY19_002204 [Arthrobacter cupressi]|nr:hypothetical protein [Arthrobacter cupressi]